MTETPPLWSRYSCGDQTVSQWLLLPPAPPLSKEKKIQGGKSVMIIHKLHLSERDQADSLSLSVFFQGLL